MKHEPGRRRTEVELPADLGHRRIARRDRGSHRRRPQRHPGLRHHALEPRIQFTAVAEKLREFLVSGRAHRIFIALHDTALLERENPRLLTLLRQFPMSVEIHRTLAQARNANDPFVVADDHSVWRQLHYEQPRAIVALHSPADALPIMQRFDEIWQLSEPAVSATTTGL